MGTQDWPDFWWNNITGPHKVITSVAEGLMSLSKVVLKVPVDLPWRHQMRNAVASQIHMMTGAGNTVIKLIDANDDWDPAQEPGRFLLQRCGTNAVARGYREKGGTSIQDYMIANGVLRDSIIWVKGLEKEQVKAWLQFCRNFHSKSTEDGLFLLEVKENANVQETRGMQVIDFTKCVREYDVQLFNSFILDEAGGCDDVWKQYAAALAAHLCETDAEVSQQFLQAANLTQDEPLECLSKVAELPELEKRGRDPASNHVLALVRNGRELELERRIWSAQLQVLFPRIELERLRIIQELHDALADCLNREPVEQFGQVLSLPEDVELGTLDYLMSRRTYGTEPLAVCDAALHSRVHFLRDCRNSLAHGGCCTQMQVVSLLKSEFL